MKQFFTISDSSEGFYKERGSKFISHALPVLCEADIKECLSELRKQFHDARHHCYAWVLGFENQTYRSNDDGEPNHSAGDPILGQIRSFGLTNILVVVVRYFGGTKLGVGGLISAYRLASEHALSKAIKKQIFETVEVSFNFPYQSMSDAELLVADLGIEITDRTFLESCQISGHLKKGDLEVLQSKAKDLYEIELTIKI